MKYIKYLVSSCYILFVSYLGTAQENTPSPEELITERPDETEAPTLVPKVFYKWKPVSFIKNLAEMGPKR